MSLSNSKGNLILAGSIEPALILYPVWHGQGTQAQLRLNMEANFAFGYKLFLNGRRLVLKQAPLTYQALNQFMLKQAHSTTKQIMVTVVVN